MTRFGPVGNKLFAALVLMLAASSGWAEEEPSLHHARFNPEQTYYLHVPAQYTGQEVWPLFIVVHGGQSRGKGDFKLWKPYADQEGFILLAPNFSGEDHQFASDSERILVKLMEEIWEDYRVDPQKILLSGFSSGGAFSYRFAMAYPALVHTVAIFNAGDFPNPALAQEAARRPRFYLAVGSEEALYAQQSREFSVRLQQAGYEAQTFVARGVGHSIPSKSIIDVLELFRAMNAEIDDAHVIRLAHVESPE